MMISMLITLNHPVTLYILSIVNIKAVKEVPMVRTACLHVLTTVSVICVSSSQGTVSSVMPDTKDLAVIWVCNIHVGGKRDSSL